MLAKVVYLMAAALVISSCDDGTADTNSSSESTVSPSGVRSSSSTSSTTSIAVPTTRPPGETIRTVRDGVTMTADSAELSAGEPLVLRYEPPDFDRWTAILIREAGEDRVLFVVYSVPADSPIEHVRIDDFRDHDPLDGVSLTHAGRREEGADQILIPWDLAPGHYELCNGRYRDLCVIVDVVSS